jgi:sec-independent protein translocase protein TatA
MQLGVPEIILVLVIALLLFGPSRIPEIGRSLGRSIREFRAGLEEGRSGRDANNPPQAR